MDMKLTYQLEDRAALIERMRDNRIEPGRRLRDYRARQSHGQISVKTLAIFLNVSTSSVIKWEHWVVGSNEQRTPLFGPPNLSCRKKLFRVIGIPMDDWGPLGKNTTK